MRSRSGGLNAAGRLALATGLALGLAGCREAPSRAECERAMSHMLDVLVKSHPEPDYAELTRPSAEGFLKKAVDDCVEHGTQKTVDCVLLSKTEEDLVACEEDQ